MCNNYHDFSVADYTRFAGDPYLSLFTNQRLLLLEVGLGGVGGNEHTVAATLVGYVDGEITKAWAFALIYFISSSSKFPAF